MTDLIRDTVAGHFVRLITKGRYLQYAEEKDPTIWKQYIDREQTLNMALHGHIDPPHELKEMEPTPSQSSGEGELLAGNSPALAEAVTQTTTHEHRSDRDTTLAEAVTQTSTHEHQLHSALTNQRVDTEKGRDATMVGWWGDNDPEVCIHLASTIQSQWTTLNAGF